MPILRQRAFRMQWVVTMQQIITYQSCHTHASCVQCRYQAGLTLRAFMMRTIAASICGLRSSSTLCLVSAFSTSPSLDAVTVLILTLISLLVNLSLKKNWSVSFTSYTHIHTNKQTHIGKAAEV